MIYIKNVCLLLFLTVLLSNFELLAGSLLNEKLQRGPPRWMEKEIKKSLSGYQNKKIPLQVLHQLKKDDPDLGLVIFEISNNQVSIQNDSWPPEHEKFCAFRVDSIMKALITLCEVTSMPDIVFAIGLFDSIAEGNPNVPIFAMAKDKNIDYLPLIPDFEVLAQRYQVIPDKDVTKWCYPWSEKISQAVWRGSTAQGCWKIPCVNITEDNCRSFSRVRLCELSKARPSLINAGFTLYAQGAENIPYLSTFEKCWIACEDQIKYKYHIMIDGNSVAYSNSGWKLFSNSLIFKEDSPCIQWYFEELKPYVHYIPVKPMLTDLIDKIQWAKKHDQEAEQIAANAYRFACTHIAYEDTMAYLYFLLKEYSQLKFVK